MIVVILPARFLVYCYHHHHCQYSYVLRIAATRTRGARSILDTMLYRKVLSQLYININIINNYTTSYIQYHWLLIAISMIVLRIITTPTTILLRTYDVLRPLYLQLLVLGSYYYQIVVVQCCYSYSMLLYVKQ